MGRPNQDAEDGQWSWRWGRPSGLEQVTLPDASNDLGGLYVVVSVAGTTLVRLQGSSMTPRIGSCALTRARAGSRLMPLALRWWRR